MRSGPPVTGAAVSAKRAIAALKTLAVFLLSVLALSLLVFVIARLAPGDPLRAY